MREKESIDSGQSPFKFLTRGEPDKLVGEVLQEG
jgi:hypothetical protein